VICEFGDVVLVPFPFVDRAAEKRRPSAVLSKRDFNASHGHSICAMITTAARTHWPSDVAISDLASAGLPRACVLRWKLFTLPNELILRRAGRLADDELERVAATLRTIMVTP
jgi:mRNA interferase MazF